MLTTNGYILLSPPFFFVVLSSPSCYSIMGHYLLFLKGALQLNKCICKKRLRPSHTHTCKLQTHRTTTHSTHYTTHSTPHTTPHTHNTLNTTPHYTLNTTPHSTENTKPHNTHLIPEELGDMSTVGGLDEVDGFSHAPVQGVLVQRQGAAGWGQGEVGAGGGHGHRGSGAADRQGGGAGEGPGHVGPPHGAGLRARRLRAGCP